MLALPYCQDMAIKKARPQLQLPDKSYLKVLINIDQTEKGIQYQYESATSSAF